MPITFYGRDAPPKNHLSATQQRARANHYSVTKAGNCKAYKGTAADLLGHVVICDFAGNELAGPFDLDAADMWLDTAKLSKLIARTPTPSTAPAASTEPNEKAILEAQLQMHRNACMPEADIKATKAYRRLAELGGVNATETQILEEQVAMFRNAGMPAAEIEKTSAFRRLVQIGGAK